MAENMTEAEIEIDNKFLEQARMNIQEAQALLNCPQGTYLTHAEQDGAIKTAISLIRRNGRAATDGFVRLLNEYNRTGNERLKALTFESLFLEFAEKYQNRFPDLFPADVITLARRLMQWRKQ